MTHELLTVSKAAHRLECPESMIRRGIQSGKLRVHAIGPRNANLMTVDDVDDYGLRARIGRGAREQRTIMMLGKGTEDIAVSLEAAGLHAQRPSVPSIVQTLREAPGTGVPIIVMSAYIAHCELTVLQAMLGELCVLVVANRASDVPWEIESRIVVAEPTEYAKVSKWCWGHVQRRFEDIAKRIDPPIPDR